MKKLKIPIRYTHRHIKIGEFRGWFYKLRKKFTIGFEFNHGWNK
jgi:hypothetical protein